MPTFPKRPPVAPAPLLPDELQEGSKADDFLKPSEFKGGGYYDDDEGAALRHEANRPAAFSLDPAETLKQHHQAKKKPVATPTRTVKKKKIVTAPAPVPVPSQFNSEYKSSSEEEDYSYASYAPAVRRDYTEERTGKETNYSVIKHMMKTGSSQNRQVTSWATTFRDMPKRGNAKVGKPTWNLNTKKNSAWKSLDEFHADVAQCPPRARRPSTSSYRKPLDESRFEPMAAPSSAQQSCYQPQQQPQASLNIREQLSLTRSRLQASLGSSLSHTDIYSPHFPTASTW
eukprot:TRINITY_DN7456_c2_g1_i1.p1 TRINITY_DN7456_c2_g1~~TRINITY_DN7456_c2_g1_i1.p1  ORF type:complete len:286 (+),score=41.98 TRINITY_DN7456_c2_g1_i1:66-923(+)